LPGEKNETMAKLLLVDDDPVLLNLLGRLLRRAGHDVTEAASGEECLVLAARERFDVIVTDVMMPGLDGYELTRRLRADPATREVLILVVTSGLHGTDPALARLAGADDSDMKSVNVARLNEKIEALLAAHAASLRRPPTDPVGMP
jgi:two-component system, cell cycle response regulator DivK